MIQILDLFILNSYICCRPKKSSEWVVYNRTKQESEGGEVRHPALEPLPEKGELCSLKHFCLLTMNTTHFRKVSRLLHHF